MTAIIKMEISNDGPVATETYKLYQLLGIGSGSGSCILPILFAKS